MIRRLGRSQSRVGMRMCRRVIGGLGGHLLSCHTLRLGLRGIGSLGVVVSGRSRRLLVHEYGSGLVIAHVASHRHIRLQLGRGHGGRVVLLLLHARRMLWNIILLVCERVESDLAIILPRRDRHWVGHVRGRGGVLWAEPLLAGALGVLTASIALLRYRQGASHGVHVERTTTAGPLSLGQVQMR